MAGGLLLSMTEGHLQALEAHFPNRDLESMTQVPTQASGLPESQMRDLSRGAQCARMLRWWALPSAQGHRLRDRG